MGARPAGRRRSFLHAVSDALSAAGALLGGSAIVLMMVIVLREIIGRFFFRAPTSWVNEYTGYLVAAVTFLGAAYALRADALLRVTVFTQRLSPARQRLLARITTGLAVITLLVITYYAGEYYVDTLTAGRRSNTPQQLPLAIPRITMLVGLGALCVEVLRELLSPTIADPSAEAAAGSVGEAAEDAVRSTSSASVRPAGADGPTGPSDETTRSPRGG